MLIAAGVLRAVCQEGGWHPTDALTTAFRDFDPNPSG
jgi:hypothetical protein